MKRLCLILAYLFLFTQTASAMPLLVGQKVVYRGTITGLRISAVDGTAFIDNAGATIPTYADGNHQIEIYDSSNRMLKGVLKAAGTSEGLGDNLSFLSSLNLAAWSVYISCSATDADTMSITGSGAYMSRSFSLTAEALYRGAMSATSSPSGVVFLSNSGGTSHYAKSTGETYTTTAKNTTLQLLYSTPSGGTVDFTSISLRQILAPSSSGATITTLKNGDVYNWSYKNSSFTYNASSYYVIIRAIR